MFNDFTRKKIDYMSNGLKPYLPDGLDFLKKVKGIIEQKGKFPVKVSKGWNYHEMEDILKHNWRRILDYNPSPFFKPYNKLYNLLQ